MLSFFAVLGLAVTTLLVGATSAQAQMPSERLVEESPPSIPHVERYQDWLLTCEATEERRACQFQPASAETPGDAPVGLVIVSAPDGGDIPIAIFRSPLGVLLSAGITLRIDGRQVGRLAFQTCEADGCVAPARLEGALVSGMRRGTALEAELTMRDGSTSVTRISLMGVTAGLRALREAR